METGKDPHPPAWSRPLRRAWRPFLGEGDQDRVRRAIEEAERATTARIRVDVVGSAGGRDLLELARIHFRKHGLHHDKSRGDVLILIAHLDHRFAIWGGREIHSRAGDALWRRASEALLAQFRQRRYPDGIEACVRELGLELARHFPKGGG